MVLSFVVRGFVLLRFKDGIKSVICDEVWISNVGGSWLSERVYPLPYI